MGHQSYQSTAVCSSRVSRGLYLTYVMHVRHVRQYWAHWANWAKMQLGRTSPAVLLMLSIGVIGAFETAVRLRVPTVPTVPLPLPTIPTG